MPYNIFVICTTMLIKNANKFVAQLRLLIFLAHLAVATRCEEPPRKVKNPQNANISQSKAKQLDITGQLNIITSSVVEKAIPWFEKHKKPVMMLEYGADTLEGLHIHPKFIWSEEYQVELMSKHFKAFDVLRKKGFFVGEFIWNFADFKMAQTYTRVGGNKKGVFTRNRQPKASAHHLRRRYFKLAEELYNASLPNDLYLYTASRYVARDEL